MNKINIQFGGITRIPDGAVANDGDMEVLLNARHEAGELVPIKRPTVVDSKEDIAEAKYHAQSGCWLELRYYRTILMAIKDDGKEITAGMFNDPIENFELMGNIVILYTRNTVEYVIWRKDDYVQLGQLPELPEFYLKNIKNETFQTITNERYYYVYNPEKPELYHRYVQSGFIDKCLNSIYEHKGYIDRTFFIVAARLFDGTYIRYSSPIQVSYYSETGQDFGVGYRNFRWEPRDSSEDYIDFYAFVECFYPEFRLRDIDKLYSKWEEIILSIDVFSCGSIMSRGKKRDVYESSQTQRNVTTIRGDEYEWYEELTPDEIKENIENSSFYKVAEFNLKGELTWEIRNTSPSMLAQQTVLTFTGEHSHIGKTSVYNSKLHLYDIKTVLFPGYKSFYKLNKSSIKKTEYVPVAVHIKVNENIYIVEQDVSIYGSDSTGYPMPGFIIYPDSRAFKMVFYYDEGTYEIELRPHPLYNVAYYVNAYNQARPGDTEDGGTIAINAVGVGISLKESKELRNPIDNVVEDDSIFYVSEVDNPFYFPAAQTYKFDSPIVNIASNTETISQGQFGQYPLFVFTKSGIWAMAVDTSGKGAYVSQAPFSREVCNGEVLPISGGVVFGTDKGVMAISGGDVVELSQMLNGTSPFMFPYNEQLFGKIYELAGYSMALNPIDIKEYIKGAKFAYNYKTGEIIVCNHDYGFSYVYGLKTQKWTMSDVVFTNTTNSYPELVTYEGGVQMKWNEEDFENVPIVLITRPVKVDTLDFKRLRQAALRCTFEGSLNFYVLGSNDGVNFVCITGKEYPSKNGDEPTDVTRRDLITSMSRSKQYKYIAIAVAGKMRGRISLAELLVDAGFASNRLR